MSGFVHLATDPRVSAFVSANAGSGKTYVLTSRIIRLLLEGAEPSRMLCLTFTRAAAAEMRLRVFSVLGAWALLNDEALSGAIQSVTGRTPDKSERAEARRLFARALETPGGLKIQTIHGFCESLIKRFPLEAGAPVPFEILDDLTQARLQRGARDGILQAGSSRVQAALERLAPYLDEGAFDVLFTGETARYLRAADGFDPFAVNGLEAEILPEHVAAEAALDAPQRRALFEEAAHAFAASDKTTDQSVAERITAALEADPAERLGAFAAIFQTQKGEWLSKDLGTKALRGSAPKLFAQLDAERARLEQLHPRYLAASNAAVMQALQQLFNAINARFVSAKRAQGFLDYDDLIEIAAGLLSGPQAVAWALYKLDGGVDHILVDEAQDTSAAQWRIIESLAAEFFSGAGVRGAHLPPRTIFAVGDEKQSIFSFQGADPSGFARMRDRFRALVQGAAQRFETPVLDISRRSVPAVLQLTDAVFKDEALRKAVSLLPWAQHRAHRHSEPGAVELWPVYVAPAASAPDEATDPDAGEGVGAHHTVTLAGMIAARISEMIGREAIADGAGGLRPVTAGDIMILVRRRGQLADAILRCLKERQIPVAGADRLALTQHIAVKDLIALGRVLLQPRDDLALACVLRGPLCNVSEEALFHLAHGREGMSLWRRLEKVAEGHVAGFDVAIAQELSQWLQRLSGRAARLTPFAFYLSVLSGDGGRALMLKRFGTEAEDILDEFLSEAANFEAAATPSLEGFLHALETSSTEVKRDPDAAAQAVRLLTVHGAKGLEAPVVFLPDTMFSPNALRGVYVLPAPSGGAVFAPVKSETCAKARLARELASDDEQFRLLYVALTRARDRLIVCGSRSERTQNGPWYQAIQNGFDVLPGPDVSAVDTPAGIGRLFGAIKTVAAQTGAVAGDTPLPEALLRAADIETSAEAVRPSRIAPFLVFDDAARKLAVTRGRILHGLLQNLPTLAADARRAAGLRYLSARAGAWSLAEREAALDEALRLISDERFAALFGPHARAEAPIVGRVAELGAEGWVSGQVDRLAVEGDRVLLADFKTDRRPPKDAQSVPAAYLAQMALYRAVLAGIFPGRRIEAALIYTHGPQLIGLSDALLDQALARLAAAPAAEKADSSG